VFPSFTQGFYRMFVLMTSVNNPDVWLPLYNDNRLYFLLFSIYATFAIFIMLNVLLARIFRHYKGAQTHP
jgi:hypothetical protein